MKTLQDYVDKLNKLDFKEMCGSRISAKVFESGPGISLFRGSSARTRIHQ